MNETFGKRIYRLRKSANMTQKELANLLGISEPAVCKWETDNSMPDIMLLTPLARALHTDLNTLFSYESTLSPEQVKAFADAAEGISIAEGTDAATQYWTERLQEYPNCELLQMAYVKWLMKLQAGEIEKAAECFESYVENMVHAEEYLKSSIFFGNLGEDARFISNGTLVSLNDFRDELVSLMQNPTFLKPLRENEEFLQSMEKLNLYITEK